MAARRRKAPEQVQYVTFDLDPRSLVRKLHHLRTELVITTQGGASHTGKVARILQAALHSWLAAAKGNGKALSELDRAATKILKTAATADTHAIPDTIPPRKFATECRSIAQGMLDRGKDRFAVVDRLFPLVVSFAELDIGGADLDKAREAVAWPRGKHWHRDAEKITSAVFRVCGFHQQLFGERRQAEYDARKNPNRTKRQKRRSD